MPTKEPSPVVALELKELHKSFGSLEVLKGVSLTAKEGDVISIIGSSGSGKSTLVNELAKALRRQELLYNSTAHISFTKIVFRGG